ncbi:MAG: hypothetical protein ACRD1O_02075 [Terriglobia bacterium]
MNSIVANRCFEIMALIFGKPCFTGKRLKAPVWQVTEKRLGACHSEPFACHPERSEGSPYFAQGKLREESRFFPFQYDKQLLPDFAGTGRSAQHDKMDFFSSLLGR